MSKSGRKLRRPTIVVTRPERAATLPAQRAAQAIAVRLAGRLRRGIEVSAVPAPGPRR